MKEYEVINYHIDQYKRLLEQEKAYRKWKENNKNYSKYSYFGPIPTKAEMKRVRLTLQKLMLDVERSTY
jgi:hypothetical protein